jgi:hypothetical protein
VSDLADYREQRRLLVEREHWAGGWPIQDRDHARA